MHAYAENASEIRYVHATHNASHPVKWAGAHRPRDDETKRHDQHRRTTCGSTNVGMMHETTIRAPRSGHVGTREPAPNRAGEHARAAPRAAQSWRDGCVPRAPSSGRSGCVTSPAHRDREDHEPTTRRPAGAQPQGANRPDRTGSTEKDERLREDDDGASRSGRESERPLVIAIRPGSARRIGGLG
ncbi:hypothetical protein [Brachybacterium sacelli]|uniref:hypothetical protein n=1 Tax=Brachybacterium sacelli TaxID=173364 RepID=UPI00361C3B75